MNHKTWISVVLDDGLPDDKVKALIRRSFDLTKGKAAVMDEELVRKVLDVALSIPPGKVASYGQIAKIVGKEKNSRMVGRIMSMADRYGDYPCHRVVNSAGRTVPGWPEQRELLEAEGVSFKKNGCVDMDKYRWEK
ncbi:MAG: MGMT family protein [Mogibacterium sp.]|nr:MGMT family protein [Mogibacterium sp.]